METGEPKSTEYLILCLLQSKVGTVWQCLGSSGLLSDILSYMIFCLTSDFVLSIYCNYAQFNVVQDII